MSTVYTLNGKVLKNAANDKWLTKKEAPAGFVMNASTLAGRGGPTSGYYFLCWKGPDWPAGCNLNGQTARITISSDITSASDSMPLFYAQGIVGEGNPGGPEVLRVPITAGTYDITCANNVAGSTFGVCLNIGCPASEEAANEVLSKCTITILDP